MALRKSPASTNAPGYARQNAKNKGFSSHSLRTRAFFGAPLFALLYVLLLNVRTCESGDNGLPQVLLNHRPPRSLGERTMLTMRGTIVKQEVSNPETKKRNKKPLPDETVEDYLERSCGQVELTEEMQDKLKSCDPDITEKDMCKMYSKLYNEHISNFRHLVECLKTATDMLGTNYKQDPSFQKKCWFHQYNKLGRDLIRLSDNDDDGGLKVFLQEKKTCKTSDFTKFLNDRMKTWNAFIKEKKKVAYAELKEALQSGTLKKSKGKK
ncbi:unnamed protein product [Plasmodium vivax]|nr:unnamed protein product [Plasmodium vivax]